MYKSEISTNANRTSYSNIPKVRIENLIPFKDLIDRGIFKKGTLYFYTSHRKIPFIKIGRNIMFNKPELELWLAKRRVVR